MEQTLKPAKSDFLLEGSLEILHEQTRSWMEEVDFWKEECTFFYTLIISRSKVAPLLKTMEAKTEELNLINISAVRLYDLKSELEGHEKYLARIIESKNLDESLYRKRHREITEKIKKFESEFKEVKKEIFHLVKKDA